MPHQFQESMRLMNPILRNFEMILTSGLPISPQELSWLTKKLSQKNPEAKQTDCSMKESQFKRFETKFNGERFQRVWGMAFWRFVLVAFSMVP
jgi:hypothetical protein